MDNSEFNTNVTGNVLGLTQADHSIVNNTFNNTTYLYGARTSVFSAYDGATAAGTSAGGVPPNCCSLIK